MDKKENREIHTSVMLVGTGQLTVNIHSTWRWSVENKRTARGFVVCAGLGGCTLRGLDQENDPDIPKACYHYRRWKKTVDRLM